jgi:DeoR family glycerol-3-phosphate regulon repressor
MQDFSHRQNEILALARSAGRVSVDDLAVRFDVTPQTIRKDLNDLCDRRLLNRVHGGAVVASGIENLAYEARRFIAAEEKRAIGKAAAALIPNQSSLFINIGTTTEEVAANLMGHEELLVITNNLNVAMLLYRHPTIEVLDFDYREVKVSQAIIENARKVILVADRLKLERAAPVKIAHLSQIHTFITDSLTSAELRDLCATHNVQVVETSGPAVFESENSAA